MKRTLLIAGGLLLAAGAAYAGGLGDTIVEMAPPAPAEPMMDDAGSSIPGWVIPLAIVGLMIGLASTDDDDDGNTVYDILAN